MDAFYRALNIHKSHTYLRNKQIGEVTSADRQSDGLQNVRIAHNVQTRCIKSCIFDTCYTFLWTVLHAEQLQELLYYLHTTERSSQKLQ